ncbi:MASE1 domain-containing protein [Caulobacter sp. 17J65-9]|uniref:MASE1 domain-containing protein n=1 Tax=Caulobacter sp. 17J65-9 TaxID=2709382 RepID=UPI0013CDCB9A|nr:MASE1 domain-containing protein [Caulobacter sp. 17J65-9]NEX94555.1 PAS domain-containing protein [Caulobacter sp. 17J65-9]
MTLTTRTVIGVGALTAGYAVLGYLGLTWATFGAAVSPVWPASGLAIAALLLGGLRLWPGIFLGSLVATSLAPAPDPILVRLLFAAGDALAVVVGVWLLLRIGRFDRDLRRVRDVFWLILIGAVVSGLISGVLALGVLTGFMGLPADAAPAALLRWTVGDTVGVITVTPVILTWARPDPLHRNIDWWVAFAALLGTSTVLAWLIFVTPTPGGMLLPWHLAPLVIAAAFMLDARAASSIGLVSSALALYGAQPGGGAFAELSQGRVLAVQQYVMIMQGTIVLVAVMVEALRRARTAVENEQVYLATAENEARLRLAQEAGQVGTWDWNIERGQSLSSDTLLEIFGWPLTRPDVGFDAWVERVHPDDRERALEEVKASYKGSTAYSSLYRILLPSGEVRHVDSRARLFYGPDGRVRRVLGVVVDITERKEAEERQRLLMREVDHRAKNALAVVAAVVRLTKAETKETFAAAVEGRIQAIARAHNLLAASRWTGASLPQLIDEEIEPYQGAAEKGGVRIRAKGPEVMLAADAAQPLALVLHELITNAAKHGALSAPGGSVDLKWTVDPEADRLKLDWTEKGGPDTEAPSRAGFGSTLMTASVERQLNGELRLTWRKSGLHCEIEIPLQRVVRAAPLEAGAESARVVLLVEDEALIGLDMKARLEALGWSVIGPIGGVAEALGAIEATTPAAAVLDVNLAGEATAPVARRLSELHVPFAFATGYGDFMEGAREFDAPVLVKPVTTEELKHAFDRLHVGPEGRDGAAAPP